MKGSEDGRTHNIGFCNIGAEAIPISIGSLLGIGSGRSFSIIFCTLFVHLFFNWAAVPGGRFSNSPTSQSPTVVGYAVGQPSIHNEYSNTLKRLIIYNMRILFLLIFLIPTVVFSQTNQGTTDTVLLKLQLAEYLIKAKATWTKIEKPKAFELSYFKKAGLMPPKSVKRFYKFDNNDSTNYLTTAIYETENTLVKGNDENMYRYYDVSFSGIKEQFTLNYSYSVGLGYTCQGTYFVESGVSLQTDYGYGTSSGTITVYQNEKKIATKKIIIKQ